MRNRCLALVLLLQLGETTYGQVASFKADVDYVQLAVRVVDKRGKFVTNLQQYDFQVFEDGRLQAIADFESIDIPIPSDKTFRQVASSGASSTRSEREAHLDSRVYLFVLDDYHLPVRYTSRARAFVKSFVQNRLGPDDLAAIAFPSGARGQELTGDRSLLLSAVQRYQATFDYREPAQVKELKARKVLRTIADVVKSVEFIPRRHKALMYFGINVGCRVAHGIFPNQPSKSDRYANLTSDGTGIAPDAGTLILCNTAVADTVAFASRSAVSIYSIDPRGLQDTNWIGPSVDGRGGPGAARERMTITEPGRPDLFDGFHVLSEQTGGFAVTGTNAINRALDVIVEHNSSYYLLGYYSDNPQHDGKFRVNRVSVSGDHLSAHYRSGYLAPQ